MLSQVLEDVAHPPVGVRRLQPHGRVVAPVVQEGAVQFEGVLQEAAPQLLGVRLVGQERLILADAREHQVHRLPRPLEVGLSAGLRRAGRRPFAQGGLQVFLRPPMLVLGIAIMEI
jgi:hypothetical protein